MNPQRPQSLDSPGSLGNNQASNPVDSQDYTKPVAYDNEGRPLYAHPPTQPTAQQAPASQPEPIQQRENNQQSAAQHQYVHVTRPMAPDELEIPEYIKERHAKSMRKYPQLNLSDGEYIINAVKRHPIGLLQIWGGAILIIVVLGALLVSLLSGEGISASSEVAVLSTAGLGLFAILIVVGAFIATYVYNKNRFFLTNESVIQEIQNSLFSNHEQTVSLANIEDASYRQTGLLAYLLDYGTIRLSTEGDETTYRFSYVTQPKQHIAVLNNAVESFKNGRAVDPPGADKLD